MPSYEPDSYTFAEQREDTVSSRERPQSADNAKRTAQSERFVELMQECYWNEPTIATGLGFIHEPHGYEHTVPAQERLGLRYRYDQEAMAIRFRPDALVKRTANGEETYILIEYKTTTTPRYTYKLDQWDRGQIEADPWEYYLRRIEEGERLALCIYCSYHRRPFLCDYPSKEWQVGERQKVGSTRTGSYTDFYNIDLTKLRTFMGFMQEEFSVPPKISFPLMRRASGGALSEPLLQTSHNENSPFSEHGRYGNIRLTGFNWNDRYFID